jgi:ribosomal-protein-alanine N-acetyltransferase
MYDLISPRLGLRGLNDGDVVPTYVDWLNDPDVNRYLEIRHEAHDQTGVRQFVASMNDNPRHHLFGMFLRESDRHIGNIKLSRLSDRYPVGDVSLLIGARDCWGRGFATEAIRTVTAFGFGDLGLVKLEAGAYAPNIGSIRAFLSAGWQQEGILRSHAMCDDQPVDVVKLGILSSEHGAAADS